MSCKTKHEVITLTGTCAATRISWIVYTRVPLPLTIWRVILPPTDRLSDNINDGSIVHLVVVNWFSCNTVLYVEKCIVQKIGTLWKMIGKMKALNVNWGWCSEFFSHILSNFWFMDSQNMGFSVSRTTEVNSGCVSCHEYFNLVPSRYELRKSRQIFNTFACSTGRGQQEPTWLNAVGASLINSLKNH